MFNNIEQSVHCDQLIAFLDKLPNKKYDQLIQVQAMVDDASATCALGWAASMNIGGLSYKHMKVYHPDIDSVFTSIPAAEYVFGKDVYVHVFGIWKLRENNELKMTEKQLAVNRLKQMSQALKKGSSVKLVRK